MVIEKENRLKLILNLAVLTISLLGIMRSNYRVNETSFFERTLIGILAPIQDGTTYLQNEVKSFVQNYFFLVDAKKENESLKLKVANLETQIFSLTELKKENQRLKELLQFGQDLTYEKVLARVVGWDADHNFKFIRINKGSDHGIKEEYPVVSAEGIVGYIYQVTDKYADIITILDQNNRIDTIVSRTRSHGIVEGYTHKKCLMKYVNRTEPIILNDIVVTSGLGNIYPKGLRVGTISKIERESYGITQFVEVTPSVDFDRLEEVIVLLPENMP